MINLKLLTITAKISAFDVAHQSRRGNLSSLRVCRLVAGELDGTQQANQILTRDPGLASATVYIFPKTLVRDRGFLGPAINRLTEGTGPLTNAQTYAPSLKLDGIELRKYAADHAASGDANPIHPRKVQAGPTRLMAGPRKPRRHFRYSYSERHRPHGMVGSTGGGNTLIFE